MIETLHNYLVIGAVLFVLGAIGFITRRNLIIMFLSAELMLQGVTINLIAFGRYHGNMQGQSFVVFLLTVAACEAAIALALVLVLYQQKKSLDIRAWSSLGEVPPPPEPREPITEIVPPAGQPAFPKLTPAGPEPKLPERKVFEHV